ncbi:hypothetical protein HGRIS_008663 [Hohenbuehelia grisea]|uniref:Uncharacterized protein n=1 Tax=Hohenbuehelia grisea TaxID=104357 RepID=A0ABR3J8P2_9AGAR
MTAPIPESPAQEDLSPTVTATEYDETQASSPDILTPLSADSETTFATLVEVEDTPDGPGVSQKKKKKKKAKKPASKAKDEPPSKTSSVDDADMPPVLCISRNKHWKYISSYHGPWLQLPLELLDSLLVLNLDPATLSAAEPRLPPMPTPSPSQQISFGSKQRDPFSKHRDRGFLSLNDHSPPSSPHAALTHLPMPPPIPPLPPGKAAPPPIDPGVFRSVTAIRRLIDEAAELSVRASSGLSAAELGSMRGGSAGIGSSPWAAAQALGFNPLGNSNNGRNVAMSAMRVHRLRALVIQKLAQAYKIDEIASSVMVMQGGSVFDDIAERVLKVDPNDIDAKYVHFFHEKIPSRQLAESTTTDILDELIAMQPHRLEFYRTRGIVRCFRDEYQQATKDFTYALKEARAVRKAKTMHRNNSGLGDMRTKNGKKRKGSGNKTNGRAPPNGTSVNSENVVDGPDGEVLYVHPSVLPDAPDPIEPQLLFLRGSAYLQHAVFLIETAILKLEAIRKVPSTDGAELRLCYIENGKYGGVEIGNPHGPLGKKDGAKLQAYRAVFAEPAFREQISGLLEKCIRDHKKFLSHFDTLEASGDPNEPWGDLAERTEYAFLLSEAIRPGNHSAAPSPPPDAPGMFTTYHPLLVEAHFSVLLSQLMLGDFVCLLPTFARTASLVDGLEGYPVFLPPRSMTQAEFVEVLERLAGGWRHGTLPHSLSRRANMKDRLAIPAPLAVSRPASSASSATTSDYDPSAASSSTATLDGGDPISESLPGAQDDEKRAEALDSIRILLAPVLKRQRERADKTALEKSSGGAAKKPLTINIPLHGPRVEIVLAWLGAVHLPDLET